MEIEKALPSEYRSEMTLLGSKPGSKHVCMFSFVNKKVANFYEI